MDWFLYDNGPRHERVKADTSIIGTIQLIYRPNQYPGPFVMGTLTLMR